MKVFCSNCKQETNHKILKEIHKTYDFNEDVFLDGTWQIIECNGCELVSFRQIWINSEDYNPVDGFQPKTIIQYPVRNKDSLIVKTYYNLPTKIRNIYSELIDAYNNGTYILCSAGLRAAIEGICKNKNISDGPVQIKSKEGKVLQRRKDLQGKIKGLYEKGLLTQNHAEILHEHRLLGNNALHTLDQPTKEELKIAIEILEHTIENIYELSEKGSDLAKEKNKRKR